MVEVWRASGQSRDEQYNGVGSVSQASEEGRCGCDCHMAGRCVVSVCISASEQDGLRKEGASIIEYQFGRGFRSWIFKADAFTFKSQA